MGCWGCCRQKKIRGCVGTDGVFFFVFLCAFVCRGVSPLFDVVVRCVPLFVPGIHLLWLSPLQRNPMDLPVHLYRFRRRIVLTTRQEMERVAVRARLAEAVESSKTASDGNQSGDGSGDGSSDESEAEEASAPPDVVLANHS